VYRQLNILLLLVVAVAVEAFLHPVRTVVLAAPADLDREQDFQ